MMARAFLLPLGCLALALVGCGGVSNERPDGSPTRNESGENPCTAAEGYAFGKLVDFDPLPGDMPESVRVQQCDGVTRCNINFNYDSVLSPTGDAREGCPDAITMADPILMQSYLTGTSVGDRCSDHEYATHIFARDLATCTSEATGRMGWGGSLSFSFASPGGSDATFDASEWDGFSFWIKKSSPTTGSTLIAAAVDLYTSGKKNIDDPFGGPPRSCDASGLTDDPATGEPIADTEKCDGFGVAVTIEDDWTFVPVRFVSLRQKGFGMPSPVGHVVTEELVRVQFLMAAGDWDFWIDDLSFFRGQPE